MEDSKRPTKSYVKPSRLFFPDEIKIHEWLPLLIEAYYIVDKGIAEAIKKEVKKKRKAKNYSARKLKKSSHQHR